LIVTTLIPISFSFFSRFSFLVTYSVTLALQSRFFSLVFSEKNNETRETNFVGVARNALVHANNRTAFIGDQVTPIIGIRWLDL
jgi:hypothetical protein